MTCRPSGRYSPLTLLLAAALLAIFAGCDGGTTQRGATVGELPTAPEPATEGLESAVAEALTGARQALLDDPQRASAWGRYGQVLHAHDLRREAAACYAVANRLAPAEARWPYLEGRALQPLDLDAALAAYARTDTAGTGESAVHLAWGDALLETGDPAAARRQYRQALEHGGNDAFAHFGLARTQLLDGALDAARTAAERAIELEPGLRNAYTLLAQIAQRQGDEDSARLHQWRASNLEGSPAPADPFYDQVVERGVSAVWLRRRGLAALGGGRFAEAEEALRKVLGIQPDSAADHAHLGAALARQDRPGEAIALYRRGLELEPDSPTLHNNLAQALIGQGDFESALAHLDAALRLAPNDLEARLNAGLLAGRQGRLAEARAHFETALGTAPGDVRVLGQLAPTLATMGETDAAIELWTRLLTLAPDRLAELERLARLLVSGGRHGEAIGWLRRGLDLAPNSSRLSLFLAWELATAPDPKLRDGGEALRLARRVHDAYPEMPQATDVLAAALAETGDFAGAREAIDRAIALARRQGQPTPALETRQALYRSDQAFRSPGP